MAKPNPYDVLGLPRDASQIEAKRAFRKLAADCHPDKNPGNQEAAMRFRKIKEAMASIESGGLSQKRDAQGVTANPQQTAEEIWRRIFGIKFIIRRQR